MLALFIYCRTNLNGHMLKLMKYYPQLFKDHLADLRHVDEGRLMNHQHIEEVSQYVVHSVGVLVTI